MTRAADLARRLRECRLAAGLSVPGLATRAGLSDVAVYKIEQGRGKTIQLDTAERLCRALGLTLAEFLTMSAKQIL